MFRAHSCLLCNANVGCCYSSRSKKDAMRHCTWHGAWLAPGLFPICCSTVCFLSGNRVLKYIFSGPHLITECFNKLQRACHLPLYPIHFIYPSIYPSSFHGHGALYLFIFNCCDAVYSIETNEEFSQKLNVHILIVISMFGSKVVHGTYEANVAKWLQTEAYVLLYYWLDV